MNLKSDHRTVMTLDAGGTSFRFSAMRAGAPITQTITLPSNGENLPQCLANIKNGFTQIKAQCEETPVAISFAFPGPADYPNGIIGDVANLAGFRGGVALGPVLEEIFKIPVYINNDGDLFAYGEAIGGLLPYVNNLLAQAGSPKRYKNLFGVTLGTGFGGGIVRDGELFIGDNSMAGEAWLLRNKLDPGMNAEEGACIRALRRTYAEQSHIAFADAPDPREIEFIALEKAPGNKMAALEAYRRLGEVVGDAMGNALTLIDGLGVVGGGIAHGHPLFLSHLVDELNSSYTGPNGRTFRRLATSVYNLEDPDQLQAFVRGEVRQIDVQGSDKIVRYDSHQRIGIGISRLGTSQAIALGAYAFAINRLRSCHEPARLAK